MSKKQMSLHKIGPILDSLVLDPAAPKHPGTEDSDYIKGAYADGVCGMLSLLGYDDSDLETIVPRLLLDRLTEFNPLSLAYERERFTEYLTETHPEVEKMTLSSYRELLEVLLPSVLGDRDNLTTATDTVVVEEEESTEPTTVEIVEETFDDDEDVEDDEDNPFADSADDIVANEAEQAEDARIEQERINAAGNRIGRATHWNK